MLAPMLAGLVAGAVHVLAGPDHLAAVTPLAVSDRRRAGGTGIRWGLGHTAGVAGVAVLAFLLRETLPLDRISAWSEQLVGVVLIAIGLLALRMALHNRVHAHAHEHQGIRHTHPHVHSAGVEHDSPTAHSHGHAAFGVGMLHGLAGSSHIVAVLPALGFETRAAAFAYLAGYGAASIGVMGVYARAVGGFAERLGPRVGQAYRGLLSTVAVVAIAVGAFWVVR